MCVSLRWAFRCFIGFVIGLSNYAFAWECQNGIVGAMCMFGISSCGSFVAPSLDS